MPALLRPNKALDSHDEALDSHDKALDSHDVFFTPG